MKKITFIFLLISTFSFSQSPEWARKAKATSSAEAVRYMKADAAGILWRKKYN
ncbi:MAG: hypothetical protein ACXVC6_06490 [Bacteroidia bacterium]